MNAVGGFFAGSIFAKLFLDTKDWNSGLGKAGKAMALAGGAIIGAFGKMVGSATQFNREMANVATLIPNSTARINDLKVEVQDLSVEVGKGTSDMTAGLYQVISALGDSADSMDILTISAKAGTAGMATTTDSINLLTAVTKGYGDTTEEAFEKASDLAFQTVKLGQTTFPELAASMGAVIPIAASMKVSQEELFTGFATLTGVTGDASEVSTQLKGVLTAMMKPTKGMTQAINSLGYESSQAMVQELGMVGSLRAVIGTTDGSTEAIGKLFANVRALPAVFALSGGQAEVFDEKLIQMKDSAGAMEIAFGEMTGEINQAGFSMDQAKAQFSVAAQRIGEALIPVVAKLMQSITNIIGKISDWVKEHQKLTEIIVKVVAGVGALMTVLGPVLIILPKLVTSFGLLGTKLKALGSAKSGPIFLAAAAVGFLANEMRKTISDGKELNKTIDEIAFYKGEKKVSGFSKALNVLDGIAKKFTGRLDDTKIKQNLLNQELEKSRKEVSEKYGPAYESLSGIIKDKVGGAFSGVKGILNVFKKEEIETKTETDNLEQSTDSLETAIEDLGTATEDTKDKTETYKSILSDLGVITATETKQDIDDLKGATELLHELYRTGEIDLITYKDKLAEIEGKIKDLSTTYTYTAIPAARDFGAEVLKYSEIPTNLDPTFFTPMKTKTEGMTAAIQGNAESVKSVWTDVSQRIKDKWTTELGDMLSGAKSFKEGIGAVWSEMKNMFFDLVAQMATKWITGFLSDLVSTTSKAAEGVTGSLGSAVEGVTGGIQGLASLNPAGIVTAAIAGVLGGLVSGLMGPKGLSKEGMNEHLYRIHDRLQEIKDFLFIDVRTYMIQAWTTLFNEHKDLYMGKLTSLQLLGQNTNQTLRAIRDILKTGIGGDGKKKKGTGKTTGFSEPGESGWTPGVDTGGYTTGFAEPYIPEVPDIPTPAGKTVNRNISFKVDKIEVNIEGAGMIENPRQWVRDKFMPETIRALELNIHKKRFQNALDVG